MNACALYRCFDADRRLLYVGVSSSPTDRMHQHVSQSPWAGEIASVEIERHDARDAALAAERVAIATENPVHNKAWNAGDARADVNRIAAVLSPDAMCDALGVGKHAVRYARFTGTFPGNWYGTLLPMCDAAGIDCPLSAFTWKTAKSSEKTESAA